MDACPVQKSKILYGVFPGDLEEALPSQESGTQKVLKQALLGGGVGAISAGASGGKVGQGALIGAGTNVIGGALLDTIMQPSQKKSGRVYRRVPAQEQQYGTMVSTSPAEDNEAGTHKKIIKKYDASGKLVSEEEIYY